MKHDHYADEYLARILKNTKTIGLIGASAKPERPSYGVMGFLLRHGYQVFPVNPGLAGQSIYGQLVYGNLSDVPQPIDMVDIFRNSSALPSLFEEIIALPIRPKYIWTQLGVIDLSAAAQAEQVGIEVVMNRCPAIEIPRLSL